MRRMKGKVALITGTAGGLGAALARAFSHEGARVVCCDVRSEAGNRAVQDIEAGGGEALYCHLDVTQDADWRQAVGETLARYGKLDVLVNNAGIVLKIVSIEQRETDDWDRIMAVNVKGPFLGIKHVLPVMRDNGGGSIVNISSLAGVGQWQIADPAYATSKGALRVLTKVTAAQHAKDRIRCNSVHPGPIDVGMLKDVLAEPAKLQQRLTRIPLDRMGTAAEVVTGVVYLASDESSYVTGAELVIDGGALVQ
jgi:3alpha(or 20beta)-hydroxysteroid dehydrogenase